MARFYTHNSDQTIASVTVGDVVVPIKVNGDGVFYADFRRPDDTVKGRSLPKVRRDVEAAIVARGGDIFVPFLRVNPDERHLDFDELAVTLVTGSERAYVSPSGKKCSIFQRYGGEEFLRALTPTERTILVNLHAAREDARRALEDAIEALTFDYEKARLGQKDGTYPLKHWAPLPEPEWEAEDGDA